MFRRMLLTTTLAFATSLGLSAAAVAASKTVTVHQISPQGVGASIGTVTLEDSPDGLMIKPNLNDLQPGEHGFHLHENPSCAPGEEEGKTAAGIAAGAHFDPANNDEHRGPTATHGHKGDLPALDVASDGTATEALVAPHLTVAEVSGRALMIHEGGDNYSDQPKKLGGGGPRIACAVVE
jgi:superoxide dismutase, Cu-Zn family